MTLVATATEETPVYFPAGDETLFGILTEPPAAARGTAAIVLSGGGATAPATNRNRLSVHLCRRLAGLGYHALRFDYHGIGESGGVLAGAPRVDEPYLTDLAGAIAWVRGLGIERYVLVGACFGARTALTLAPSLEGLQGMALISPPLRDLALDEATGTQLAERLTLRTSLARAFRPRTLRGLLHPARRRTYARFASAKARATLRRIRPRRPAADAVISGRFVEPIRELSGRRVPLLFVYGTDEWHYDDFERARGGRLGRALDRAPLTEVALIEGQVHGLTRVDVQARVADRFVEWLGRVDPGEGDARA